MPGPLYDGLQVRHDTLLTCTMYSQDEGVGLQCAHLLEDELSPSWLQRFWAIAEVYGGAWSAYVYEAMSSASPDIASALCSACPLIRGGQLCLANQLLQLPQWLHTAVLQHAAQQCPGIHTQMLVLQLQGHEGAAECCTTLAHVASAIGRVPSIRVLWLEPAASLLTDAHTMQRTIKLLCDIQCCASRIHFCLHPPSAELHTSGSAAGSRGQARLASQLVASIATRLLSASLQWLGHLTADCLFGSATLSRITQCSRLQRLSCCLQSDEWLSQCHTLADGMTALKQLTHLRLTMPVTGGTDAQIAALLQRMTVMRQLTLLPEHPDCEDAENLHNVCEALAALTCLTRLDFAEPLCSVCGTDMQMIGSLMHLTRLRWLGLPDRFWPEQCQQVPQLKQLRHFRATSHDQHQTPPQNTHTWRWMTAAISAMPELEDLNATIMNRRGEASVGDVDSFISTVGTLRHLTALALAFQDCTPQCLVDLLPNITQLRGLTMWFPVAAADATAVSVVESLTALQQLQHVMLCGMLPDAVCSLGCSVRALAQLSDVHISRVDADGLVYAFANHEGGFDTDDEDAWHERNGDSAQLLFEGLMHVPNLRSLTLENAGFLSYDSVEQLEEVVNEGNLASLSIEGCRLMSLEVKEWLAELMEEVCEG